MTSYLWLLAAGAVIVPLAAYAGWLAVRLRRQAQERREAAEAQAQARETRQEQALFGIRLLAGAMIEEEITLTEGCQRISYLLGQIEQGRYPEERTRVFGQVAAATAHLPILDAWRALDRRQQHVYTLEREAVERDFRDFVLAAAREILARDDDRADSGAGGRSLQTRASSSPHSR